MYIKRNMSWKLIFRYTWKNILFFVLYCLLIFFIYEILGFYFIGFPFQPLTVIGIAVSFYVGFKNSQSYDRFWEGRKIWGSVVNYSRTWAIRVISFVDTDDEAFNQRVRTEMVHRHVAWINALRVQLRQPRSWSLEHGFFAKRLFDSHAERNMSRTGAHNFISQVEYENIRDRPNIATHLVKNQANSVTQLRKDNVIDAFQEMQLQAVLEEFYNLQGMCERIKNTPFPRQYAYMSKIFTWIFVLLLPLGLLNIFEEHVQSDTIHEGLKNPLLFLQMIPFAVLIMWIFTTMEMVGDSSEDPFDGRANDVPMTALCRTIEIDLRDMLNEKQLPKPIEPKDDILY
ncbi:bestrophin family protein [Flavimarina sp. Hel_I_48]|uniref:bestrophin family protein n=1 Tax=Flavimarina sp. Hel_I_48 TaxID=1392488 RepID=UPI0004DF1A63|nr:bestrophin family ion channel [Flavimarina sp. Hel_I_48]